MIAYVIRRLLLMIPTTIGIALVVFLLFHAAPGDPATVMIGMGGGGQMTGDSDVGARADKFRRKYGLDRALPVQFFNYIGPFNLLRDGHPWFSSPCTERKTEELELADGTTVVRGKPVLIPHLPETTKEQRAELDSLALALAAVDTGEAGWAAAAAGLAAQGAASVPVLLNLFMDERLDIEHYALPIERVAATLASATGHQVEPDAAWLEARGSLALIESWYAWYYEGPGKRVNNSGAKKWGGLLTFDLGSEMQRKTPVGTELVKRLKITVPLSLTAVLLSYLIALPLGIFSARRHGTKLDGLTTVIVFVLYSIPTFWAGLMLILLFGVTGPDWWWWPRLPVLGMHDKDAATFSSMRYAWDTVLHCILPVATLTYGGFAYLSRQMRSGMLEVLTQDYIRTARAKGLAEGVVIYKHALRNSLIPVITLFASILPILVGGSIIVEAVFNIQGMGKYAYEGLLRRDFNIVMATTIFVGVMTQFGILISDITYSLVDPRIRCE